MSKYRERIERIDNFVRRTSKKIGPNLHGHLVQVQNAVSMLRDLERDDVRRERTEDWELCFQLLEASLEAMLEQVKLPAEERAKIHSLVATPVRRH